MMINSIITKLLKKNPFIVICLATYSGQGRLPNLHDGTVYTSHFAH